MKNRITLLALNLTLAATVFAAEPSATPSPEPTSSPQVPNSSSPETQSFTQLDATITARGRRQGTSRYIAVYTKRAGNWKISQLTQTLSRE